MAKTTLELTADIVVAYLSKNAVPYSLLPILLRMVHGSLEQAEGPAARLALRGQASPARVPPVPIGETVTPDYIVSLEDGNKYQTLKRHLGQCGLSPAAYRRKWGLPDDYPMVAPNLAALRSAGAKARGLGRKPKLRSALV